MTAPSCRILFRSDETVPLEPVTPAQVLAGDPRAGVVELPMTGMTVGIWEHTAGASSDLEVDELFVVLSGNAKITIKGQVEPLLVGPGDVVALAAGSSTTWEVHETLRKLWVLPSD